MNTGLTPQPELLASLPYSPQRSLKVKFPLESSALSPGKITLEFYEVISMKVYNTMFSMSWVSLVYFSIFIETDGFTQS